MNKLFIKYEYNNRAHYLNLTNIVRVEIESGRTPNSENVYLYDVDGGRTTLSGEIGAKAIRLLDGMTWMEEDDSKVNQSENF